MRLNSRLSIQLCSRPPLPIVSLQADVDAPRLTAEVVLAHALEMTRTQLLARPDRTSHARSV